METPVAIGAEDMQVAAKPRRRTYTAEYKQRVLKEADACMAPGAIGALLRRELFSVFAVAACQRRSSYTKTHRR